MPVIGWMRKQHAVDYVDLITEPGARKIVAETEDVHAIEFVRKKLSSLVTGRGSKLIAIVIYHDCAGNPPLFANEFIEL